MESRRPTKNDSPSSFSTPEEKWQAVLSRDPTADGHFIYAVLSTGIYCRPTCSSRRPLRKNVEFYANPAAAEVANFRVCQKCGPQGVSAAEKEARLIARVCQQIQSSDVSPSLNELAKAVALSPSHLHRRFKLNMGVTPKQYAIALRSNRLREGLAKADSVTSAIYGAGFNSHARFYASSSKMLGMTPTEYRRLGRGAKIHFAVGLCSLGSVLVAASERGVCAITLGDDPEELLCDLQQRFAQAEILPGEEQFNRWVSRVVGFIDAPGTKLDLPLDVQGTVFQKRVWQALTEIPVGSTASYSEIAERLGDPRASRAVAGACAANPLAVAIPCHRVVRVDGSLSGYRWGIERKRTLLESEQLTTSG